jgi:hypothetical protein
VSTDWEPGHRDPWRPDPGDDESPGEGRDGGSDAPDASRIAWLVVGALAIAAGTALGWDPTALSAIVTPPPYLRAALIGLAVGVAIVLLLGALNRLAGDADDAGRASAGRTPRDIGALIRGVRLVFLAVAALAAASGWLLGHPLPLVVALVIAGVDVLETSFLLIVVGLRGGR